MGHDHPPRTGLAMGAGLVVAFGVAAIVALLGLDPRIGAFGLVLLVVVCLGACVATLWMDSRATRDTNRLIDKLQTPREAAPTSESSPWGRE